MTVFASKDSALEEAKAFEERAKIAQDFRIVNGTPEGARVFGYLFAFSGVFSNSPPPDCNPNVTLVNEGRRSVGNEIVSLIVNEPQHFKHNAEFIRKIVAQAEGKTS